jgi:hypothetical protein
MDYALYINRAVFVYVKNVIRLYYNETVMLIPCKFNRRPRFGLRGEQFKRFFEFRVKPAKGVRRVAGVKILDDIQPVVLRYNVKFDFRRSIR